MKFHKQNNSVLNAEDKFGQEHDARALPEDLAQLGELAITLLNDKNLEVSKVRPFFWSLVETYVDRFQLYPFDVSKALFSYLELNDYPEKTVLQLVEQLESQFQKAHGRRLRKPEQREPRHVLPDDDLQQFRDSLKYAAMVAESDN